MADTFVGQILLVPYNFAPRNFAKCEGQLLPIAQNTALFSLLGTTYGGNGVSTFALPDLRGRAALGFGQGPGLSDRVLGESAGQEEITLLESEMPQHTHTVDISHLTAEAKCSSAAGTLQTPLGNVSAIEAAGGPAIYTNVVPDANMHPSTVVLGGNPVVQLGGGEEPHTNRQPYLGLQFVIALTGVFPPRSF